MGKRVVCIADSLELRERIRAILAQLCMDAAFAPCKDLSSAVLRNRGCDLVIYEASGNLPSGVSELERILAEHDVAHLLLVLGHDQLHGLRVPASVPSDFVLRDASVGECAARISLALSSIAGSSSDVVSIGDMELNLATYQVTVAGEPLDLTYLEYALLAFLVTHSGHTYSRDALLHHVWGFDYYGGSRTVDVHVRRVRAKLGPELAQRLETVRGVGYLWSD